MLINSNWTENMIQKYLEETMNHFTYDKYVVWSKRSSGSDGQENETNYQIRQQKYEKRMIPRKQTSKYIKFKWDGEDKRCFGINNKPHEFRH